MNARTQLAPDQNTGFLEARFAIRSRGSTVAREVLGGLATFLTLSYILFVQPPLMNAAAASTGGVSTASVLTAVCIASALACVVMGLLANFPVALAPAMGHNFFFAFVVCGAMHFTFQQALMANLIAGGIFLVLSVLGMVVPRLDPRVLLFGAIPKSQQNAIGVGIGLLIALVGLKYAGVIVQDPGMGLGLGIGKVPWTPILVAGVGLAVFGVLWARGVMGAPPWSIIASTITGAVVGVVHMPERVVALLFVLAMFFAPLVGLVAAPYMLPGAAAPVYPCLAAVLIGIGALMLSCVKEIDWDDATEALPAFLCLIIMPLTLSITDGIAFGFISYVVLKVLSGRWRQVHPFIAVCAVLLAVRYAL